MDYKNKYLLLIILFIIVLAIFLFSLNYPTLFNEFNDVGTSSNYNDHWIATKNLKVTRNDDYTTLSTNDTTEQYICKKQIDRDCVIEWDNHGKPEQTDHFIITDVTNTRSNVFNFVDYLGITGDCHVMLKISNNQLTPYVDGVAKPPVNLKADINNGLTFRFQVNANGADINYSNFTIHQ